MPAERPFPVGSGSATPDDPEPMGPEESAVLDRAIDELVVANPHQLSRSEYRYLAELIRARREARLLVFGVGRDSPLWLWVNRGGRTVFLESSARWARTVAERIPGIPICPVRYGTRRSRWQELLEGDPAELRLELPPAITETTWDVIFVDAPTGYDDRCPGRMKSIYAASELARHRDAVDVVVHDCDRPVERAFCDRFFGDDVLVRCFDRTRHYRTRRGDARASRSEEDR